MSERQPEQAPIIITERRFASVPLFSSLRHYRVPQMRADALAGLSVAAIQIPTAIAYASLAGFPPLIGLYACLLPMLVYALLGSSRQLIVGPDSATCAMIAAALSPLALAGSQHYIELSMMLALMVGGLCIMGGILRLGFIADFLSRPILVGFMNGVALSIVAGQLGKVLGLELESRVFFSILWELLHKLEQIHYLTLGVSLASWVLTGLMLWRVPRWPAPLLTIVVLSTLAWMLGIEHYGVSLVGAVSGGLPELAWPKVSYDEVRSLFGDALAISLVSFCSAMLTARSFAARNHYRIYPNQDMIALGAANISAGLSGGFVISGADSRTAINNMVGGKTSMVNATTALYILLVILLLADSLSWIPVAALGAVLIQAALKMVDVSALRHLYRVSRLELRISVLATLGVLTLGVLQGILLAVLLSLIYQLRTVARPRDAVLGQVPDGGRLFNIAHAPHAERLKGVLVYRFDASLLFFNSDYFQQRLKELMLAADEPTQAIVLDAQACANLDVTGALCLKELHTEFGVQGVRFCIAALHGQFREMFERCDLHHSFGAQNIFATSLEAVQALRLAQQPQGLEAK